MLHAEVPCPPAAPAWIRAAITTAAPLIPAFRRAPWALSLKLCDKAEAQAANTTFRHKGYVPDVLTFPLWEQDGPRVYAGDILLCWPILPEAAQQRGKPLKAHVQHLVVHSLLHLAGEDHETPAQATRMEAQEIRILKQLGWGNPYE